MCYMSMHHTDPLFLSGIQSYDAWLMHNGNVRNWVKPMQLKIDPVLELTLHTKIIHSTQRSYTAHKDHTQHKKNIHSTQRSYTAYKVHTLHTKNHTQHTKIIHSIQRSYTAHKDHTQHTKIDPVLELTQHTNHISKCGLYAESCIGIMCVVSI